LEWAHAAGSCLLLLLVVSLLLQAPHLHNALRALGCAAGHVCHFRAQHMSSTFARWLLLLLLLLGGLCGTWCTGIHLCQHSRQYCICIFSTLSTNHPSCIPCCCTTSILRAMRQQPHRRGPPCWAVLTLPVC
jgi:hypothetical protein